ncbi:MAG: very short patch repair endonuclease [Candidatus Acidiferrales bacterium]
MVDHVSKLVRSKIMAGIRSRGNTTTELPFETILRTARIRGYRKHWPVAGKPDFAWPKRKVAVFVDGCFWHGCSCKYLPRSNKAFWRKKIETNTRRDRRVSRELRGKGWTVIRVKECALRKKSTLARIMKILDRP